MTNRTILAFILLQMLFWNSTANAADGASIYQQNCMLCHGEGVAGAPKLGSAEAWKERLSKGLDAMTATVIEGVQGYSGTMPPRGGNPNLTDDQIRMTVQYMLDQLQ